MTFGPSFATELAEAGLLGLPFAWTPDGQITGREALSTAQRAKLDAVIAGHNPDTLTLDQYRRAIQSHIDLAARARSYDSGLTCSSYVGSSNEQWAAEAQAFSAWRDAVWGYAFDALAKVQTGQRQAPPIEVLLSELPTIAWPA